MDDWEMHRGDHMSSKDYKNDKPNKEREPPHGVPPMVLRFFNDIENSVIIIHSWIIKNLTMPSGYYSQFMLLVEDQNTNDDPYYVTVGKTNGIVRVARSGGDVLSTSEVLDLGNMLNMPFVVFVFHNATNAVWTDAGPDSNRNYIVNRLAQFNVPITQNIVNFLTRQIRVGLHTDEVPQFRYDIQEGSGFEENIILSNYKMPKKSKKNAQAIHQEMFGTGMDEDEMSDMEGDGISEWMSNLSKLFKLLKIRATM